MLLPDNELKSIRESFPIGCIVKAVSVQDPFQIIPHGLLGTVVYIDSTGTVFVDWENGISLGVIYKVDHVIRIV